MKILSWLSKIRNPLKESLGIVLDINGEQLIMTRHVVSVSKSHLSLVVRMKGGHTHTYTYDNSDECNKAFSFFKTHLGCCLGEEVKNA